MDGYVPQNGTISRTKECGCIITSLYSNGDHIDTFVDMCEKHDAEYYAEVMSS